MPSAEQQEQSRVSEKFHVPNSDATFDSSRVEQEQLQISEKFRAADSDITFKSSDGVLFELHKLNLAITASGFPEFRTSDEVVELSETSNVLELLFQFCYPQRHPDLELVEVEVLVSLAEAAEKYEVFPAMSVCNIRMRENISQRPFDVMLYAAKHDHTDTLEAAYKLVLKEPLDEIITKLPPRLVIPWVLHYEQYARILRKSIAQYEKWAPGRVNGKKRPAMIEKKHQSNLSTL